MGQPYHLGGWGETIAGMILGILFRQVDIMYVILWMRMGKNGPYSTKEHKGR